MTYFLVFNRVTGEAYSIGTQIADPMPADFEAVPLSPEDVGLLDSLSAKWDAETRSVIPV